MAAEAVVAKLRQAAEACQADMQQAGKAFNLCNEAADGFQKATVSDTTSEAAQVRLLHHVGSTVSQQLDGSVQKALVLVLLHVCSRRLSMRLASGGCFHPSADTCRARSHRKLSQDHFHDAECRRRHAVSPGC